MLRARVWLTCAAMLDPVSPVLTQPCRIGWEAKKRQVDLEIERPLKGAELLGRMKGWVTVDVAKANEIFAKHGRLKLWTSVSWWWSARGPANWWTWRPSWPQAFGDQVTARV